MGLRMQPRKKFFTLFSKAGSNVVESAAILMEFDPLLARWPRDRGKPGESVIQRI